MPSPSIRRAWSSSATATIIHSTAFRRLEYKTQVFVNRGDYCRTHSPTWSRRPNHRTLARMLALNEDLAEAVALAHDLGHRRSGTQASAPRPAR